MKQQQNPPFGASHGRPHSALNEAPVQRRLWQRVLATALAALLASPAPTSWAQDSGAVKSERLVELPDTPAAAATSLDRGTAKRGTNGKAQSTPGSLQLNESKSPPAPQLHLTTSIETKVENKTTNHIGSYGGGPGSGPGNGAGGGDSSASTSGAAAAKGGSGSSSGGGSRSYAFAQFVLQSVGKQLPLFAADMQRDAMHEIQVQPVTAPANYRLGPGDEVVVRAWGQIDIDVSEPFSFVVIINRDVRHQSTFTNRF